jgi:hypothetical protein
MIARFVNHYLPLLRKTNFSVPFCSIPFHLFDSHSHSRRPMNAPPDRPPPPRGSHRSGRHPRDAIGYSRTQSDATGVATPPPPPRSRRELSQPTLPSFIVASPQPGSMRLAGQAGNNNLTYPLRGQVGPITCSCFFQSLHSLFIALYSFVPYQVGSTTLASGQLLLAFPLIPNTHSLHFISSFPTFPYQAAPQGLGLGLGLPQSSRGQTSTSSSRARATALNGRSPALHHRRISTTTSMIDADVGSASALL